MIRTQSAIVWAAVSNLRSARERNCAGFVVLPEGAVCLSIAIDQSLEWSALGTPLPHIDLVVSQNHLCIDDLAAVWTNAASQLVKDIVGVFLSCLSNVCHNASAGDFLSAHTFASSLLSGYRITLDSPRINRPDTPASRFSTVM